MKQQVVVIHGGDTFENHEDYINFLRNFEIDIERYKSDKVGWKSSLRADLGADYEVILPDMPNKGSAQYDEWKIWFEKIIPFLSDGVILVGHSLGASFLVKYLSENKFPKRIRGVFLVSGVFDKDSEGYSLYSFTLPNKLDLQTQNIYLYHSKDDQVVPFSALENFGNAWPNAHKRLYEDRGHINQEKFPELATDIKSLVTSITFH